MILFRILKFDCVLDPNKSLKYASQRKTYAKILWDSQVKESLLGSTGNQKFIHTMLCKQTIKQGS